MTVRPDRVLLDTSVIVGGHSSIAVPWTISVATLAELHHGVLGAPNAAARRSRLQRLARIEATVAAIPIDAAIARVWAELADILRLQGRTHRRRTMDLMIAATARVHGLILLTRDAADFTGLEGYVEVRHAASLD